MWELIWSTQFKKDLKRHINDKEKMSLLERVIVSLGTTGSVPKEFRPHPLRGKWANHMECHIKGDFLLIWYDKVENKITLSRLGSHSELFK